jgi:hypothetical protein
VIVSLCYTDDAAPVMSDSSLCYSGQNGRMNFLPLTRWDNSCVPKAMEGFDVRLEHIRMYRRVVEVV